MLGGGYVNYFSMAGRSYKVIPQVQQSDRLNPDQLKDYFIRASTGEMVPASTVVSFKTETVPEEINHFQQLNSATISGITGIPLGDRFGALFMQCFVIASRGVLGWYGWRFQAPASSAPQMRCRKTAAGCATKNDGIQRSGY